MKEERRRGKEERKRGEERTEREEEEKEHEVKKKKRETKEIIYPREKTEEKSHNHNDDEVDDPVHVCCPRLPTKQMQSIKIEIGDGDETHPVLPNAADPPTHLSIAPLD